VRGSIPVPGPQTLKFGGNTSCVEVRCDDTLIIFDAGTGIRTLGDQLQAQGPVNAHLFLSHVHWDHIQGFPFFAPAFIAGNTIHMYGAKTGWGSIKSSLSGQMDRPNFPVTLKELPSELHFHDLDEGERLSLNADLEVTTAAGRHPGGVFIYRVNYKNHAVVYATDTEHIDPVDPKLVPLVQDADLLIYDSMYTPGEYAGNDGSANKKGWGHSTYSAGIELAQRANVQRFVLFHHDPRRNDSEVVQLESEAQHIFPQSLAAYEGLQIDLDP